ncbi:MAG: PleD family two-component system response regulator [Promethearchaeota archaeon]
MNRFVRKLTFKNSLNKAPYDILIVDDSKYIIELLTKIFTLKGYKCNAVRDYPSAMNELNNNKPRLIFLDVNMPDINGYEFCKNIKSSEKHKDILVYYLTGTSQSEISIKTLETKADGFITKPFDLSDFNDVFEYINLKKDS